MAQTSPAPYRVVCPSCGKKYSSRDQSISGKQVRCKKCGETFVAAAIPAGAGTLGSGHTTTSAPALQGYWFKYQGQVRGPYSREEVKGFREQGLIGDDSEVSLNGVNWAAATTFPELVAALPVVRLTEEAPAAGPPPQELWWINLGNGEKSGPHGVGDLQDAASRGVLTAKTLVWRKGLAEWRPAGEVPELTSRLDLPPPPLPAPPPRDDRPAGIRYRKTIHRDGGGAVSVGVAGAVCPRCRSGSYTTGYSLLVHGCLVLSLFPFGLLLLFLPVKKCAQCGKMYGAGYTIMMTLIILVGLPLIAFAGFFIGSRYDIAIPWLRHWIGR